MDALSILSMIYRGAQSYGQNSHGHNKFYCVSIVMSLRLSTPVYTKHIALVLHHLNFLTISDNWAKL